MKFFEKGGSEEYLSFSMWGEKLIKRKEFEKYLHMFSGVMKRLDF